MKNKDHVINAAMPCQVGSAVAAAGANSTAKYFTTAEDQPELIDPYRRDPWPFERRVIVCCLICIVIFITTLGNLSTILAVRFDKRLKPISNLYISSLAAADLFVGLFVMTTFMIYSIAYDGVWTFGYLVCDFWQIADYSCCSASLTNVCVIAHDRFTAVSQPLKNIHRRTKARARLLMACAWVVPFIFWIIVLSTVRVINGHSPDNTCYHIWEPTYIVIIATVIGIYVPIVIILVLFQKIMKVLRLHMTQMNVRMRSIRGRAGGGDQSEDDEKFNNSFCANRNERKRSSATSSVKFSSQSKVKGYFFIFSRKPRRSWRQKLGSIHSQSTSASEGAVTEDPSTDLSDSDQGDCVFTATETALVGDEVKTSISYRTVGINTSNERFVETVGTNTSPSLEKHYTQNVLLAIECVNTDETNTSAKSSPEIDYRKTERKDSGYSGANGFLTPPMKQFRSVEAELNLKTRPCTLEFDNITRSASFNVMPRNKEQQSNLKIENIAKANSQALYGEFMRAERYTNLEKIRLSKQISAAKTLGAIMAVLLICWIPFAIIWPIKTYCHHCISQRVYDIAVWINYLNSTVNPVIYCLCNQNFRRAYKRLFKRCAL